MHWADRVAREIVTKKQKSEYHCASGITPSGTVHFGNFREIISVEMVFRALKQRGVQARFLYFWDDYDAFRKVPSSMPDTYHQYLRLPLDRVPSPGAEDSYASSHELRLERCLPLLGIEPEYIYQGKRYRSAHYATFIQKALNQRDRIREVLNLFRSTPLPEEWWPVSVYSSFTQKDRTSIESWDGKWHLGYQCQETGNTETLDLRTSGQIKLFWRVDWPMRWACDAIDFEPAGKDHHSDGGSFDTARLLVKDIFQSEAPVSFQYDFVSIKGRGGKMSSSKGELLALDEVMQIYQAEVIRYLFASTRPNSEFSVSFDLDVIKIYEDYDRCERIAFGAEEVSEERRSKERRIYELSQVSTIPQELPLQISFRHLCSLVQITSGDLEAALCKLVPLEAQTEAMRARAAAAWQWVQRYAPAEHRFSLRVQDAPLPELSEKQRAAVEEFYERISLEDTNFEESSLQTIFNEVAKNSGIAVREFYEALYLLLIERKRGPRLIAFMAFLGKSKVCTLLQGVKLCT